MKSTPEDDNPTPPEHSSGAPATIQFQHLPIGRYFEFHGRRYQKIAMSMACNEDRSGTIFMGETEVLPV
jgi:hypothetical protein